MAAFTPPGNDQFLEEFGGPPLAYPQISTNNGSLLRGNVLISEREAASKHILRSASGHTYEVGRSLRPAIYGEVRHGILLQPSPIPSVDMRTTTEVAIKILLRSNLDKLLRSTQENPLHEIAAMQSVGHHENIISLLECVEDNHGNLYSVMEFCDGGELYEAVSEGGAIDEGTAKEWMRQILLGLTHLRSVGMCHRDLSLENVLLKNGVCKIIDFGMSLRMPVRPGSSRFGRFPPLGYCGKKNYVAPEIVLNTHPFFGHCVDLWAIAAMLFILTTGVPPVDIASSLDARYNMIVSGKLGEMLASWGIRLTDELVDLLQKLFKPADVERLSIEQILSHPWFSP